MLVYQLFDGVVSCYITSLKIDPFHLPLLMLLCLIFIYMYLAYGLGTSKNIFRSRCRKYGTVCMMHVYSMVLWIGQAAETSLWHLIESSL